MSSDTASAPARRGSHWLRPLDVAVALAVAVIQVGVAAAATHRHHTGVINALSVALLTAGGMSLIVRRRRPRAVLAFCFALALVYAAADYYPRGIVFIALIVAFWTAMLARQRLLAWLSLVAGYLLFVVLLPLIGAQPGTPAAWASGIAAWMLVLAAAAEIVRIRRERASQSALARTELSRRIAGEERLRIARELHDVLAHNLSLISVQAGVALHLVDDGRPEQTRAALAAIKHASKDALGELRSVLEILRAPDERAPRAPTDGLVALEQLTARTRDAGLPVQTRIEGMQRRLPGGVDLAAYRIIQEALTNVTKHAASAATTVTVSYRESELVIEVENEPGIATTNGTGGGGNGIDGMRERAGALGGTLHAGPRPSGGFRVLATVPLREPR